MPTIDLGSVVGPQGPQGATGATGATGAQGAAGPNQVSATTSTTLTGVLRGANSVIGTIPVDSTANASHTGNLVSSAGVANGIAYAKSTCVNPNLLDNWYFVNPVNQRGHSDGQSQGVFYGTGVTIDRWQSENAAETVTVQSDGLLWQNGATGQNGPYQKLEPERVPKGYKYTLSVMGDLANLSAMAFRISSSPYIVASYQLTAAEKSAGFATWTFTNSYDTGNFYGVSFYCSANSSAKFKAVKLELGDTQTLCHNEGTDANPVWVLNEIPNYLEQLARCQRYLYPFYGDGYRASIITANLMFCIVPTSLRNGATVTIVNDSLAIKSMAGAAQTGFTFSLTGASRNGKIEVQASKTSHGLTDGSLYSSGTTLFSAEL